MIHVFPAANRLSLARTRPGHVVVFVMSRSRDVDVLPGPRVLVYHTPISILSTTRKREGRTSIHDILFIVIISFLLFLCLVVFRIGVRCDGSYSNGAVRWKFNLRVCWPTTVRVHGPNSLSPDHKRDGAVAAHVRRRRKMRSPTRGLGRVTYTN